MPPYHPRAKTGIALCFRRFFRGPFGGFFGFPEGPAAGDEGFGFGGFAEGFACAEVGEEGGEHFFWFFCGWVGGVCDVVCFKFLWGYSLLLGFVCVGKRKGGGRKGRGRNGGGMGCTMGGGGGLCFALLHCWNRCVVNGIKDGDSTMEGMGCVWLRGWTMGLFLLRGIDVERDRS